MAKKRPTDDEMVNLAMPFLNDTDPEASHGTTDAIMEELLIKLGYPKLVHAIRESERWYA